MANQIVCCQGVFSEFFTSNMSLILSSKIWNIIIPIALQLIKNCLLKHYLPKLLLWYTRTQKIHFFPKQPSSRNWREASRKINHNYSKVEFHSVPLRPLSFSSLRSLTTSYLPLVSSVFTLCLENSEKTVCKTYPHVQIYWDSFKIIVVWICVMSWTVGHPLDYFETPLKPWEVEPAW